MKALLDTHVWLWYLLADKRLSKAQLKLIEGQGNELWLSAISVWEAHLLIERGRLPIAEAPSRWISRAMEILPVKQAPLTCANAHRSRLIRLEHEDPADRFLAATAAEMKMTLLTQDSRLLRCPDLTCVA